MNHFYKYIFQPYGFPKIIKHSHSVFFKQTYMYSVHWFGRRLMTKKINQFLLCKNGSQFKKIEVDKIETHVPVSWTSLWFQTYFSHAFFLSKKKLFCTGTYFLLDTKASSWNVFFAWWIHSAPNWHWVSMAFSVNGKITQKWLKKTKGRAKG